MCHTTRRDAKRKPRALIDQSDTSVDHQRVCTPKTQATTQQRGSSAPADVAWKLRNLAALAGFSFSVPCSISASNPSHTHYTLSKRAAKLTRATRDSKIAEPLGAEKWPVPTVFWTTPCHICCFLHRLRGRPAPFPTLFSRRPPMLHLAVTRKRCGLAQAYPPSRASAQ